MKFLWGLAILIVGVLWIVLFTLIPGLFHYFLTRKTRERLKTNASQELEDYRKFTDYGTPVRRRTESDEEFRRRELSVTQSGKLLDKIDKREQIITAISSLVGIALLIWPMSGVLFKSETETRYVVSEWHLNETSNEIEQIKSGERSDFTIIVDVEERKVRRVLGIKFTDEQWHTIELGKNIVVSDEKSIR